MVPIRYLFLEGVDCSGKSTLYRNIHKSTSFAYNIIDRSRLSRLCYARFYSRETEQEERIALLEELCDANNFFVVLVPPLETILARFRLRGDELQDEDSLKTLHSIFLEEAERISRLSNVLIVRDALDFDELTNLVVGEIERYDHQDFESFGRSLPAWSDLTERAEVQLQARFDIDPAHNDPEIMNHPHEADYYYSILKDTIDKIRDEYDGKNPYGAPQDTSSRRFYYSSDSCISSIHFLPRNDSLKVLATLRSTDAERNGAPDLRFLAHMCNRISKEFSWSTGRTHLEVRYNSLHVRKDLV